jgi:hypothetical protein
VRLRHLVCLTALAVGLSACSQEIEYTPEQRSCIAQHYSAYDAKQINQCVDVCRLCMKGNTDLQHVVQAAGRKLRLPPLPLTER